MPASDHLIAVVDDNPVVLASLGELIESLGNRALLFDSAELFFASGALDEAVCLISDLHMPHCGGLRMGLIAKILRPELPIIYITGCEISKCEREAATKHGMSLMTKPIDADQLAASIRAITTSTDCAP